MQSGCSLIPVELSQTLLKKALSWIEPDLDWAELSQASKKPSKIFAQNMPYDFYALVGAKKILTGS